MKNQRECHETLCAGKTLIHDDGTKSKYDESGVMVSNTFDGKWTPYGHTFLDFAFWQIYEEPSASYEESSATYEEVVEAKTVRVYWPDGVATKQRTYTRYYHFALEQALWDDVNLLIFDLASRRHYRMEVIE